jgi:predicted nucleic acid-binding protein
LTQSLVLDASVAVKWYIPEEGSAAARALLDTPALFIAPALLLAEVTNVLWKKVRRGEIERDDARTIAAHLCTESLIDYRAVQPLTEAALDIALQFGQTVYDALYLALAAAEDTQMVTADSRLFRSFAATPLEPFVALLGA